MDSIKFDHEKYDLKKLLDAKYPFLEKMRDRAPGTFKHSQNVSSLCEAVALELDIDSTLMKVLGMYYDAGKISFPECFYENQIGSGNIHDGLDPMISFHLLTKHIADGALILIQLDDFPSELIEPITQHHGNTAMMSLANKTDRDHELFRYRNTSPPTTLEAAILMICDSVEATTRAMYNNGDTDNEFILKAVDKTILRLMDDQQLDQIKVGILNKTKKILIKELESIYHKRILYEDDDKTVGELREE